MSIFKILASIIIAFFSLKAMALAPGDFYLGLGQYSQNMVTTTATEKGSSHLLGTANYPLHIRSSFQAWGSTLWTPRLGVTLLPRQLKDSAGTSQILMLSSPFTQKFDLSNWDWSYGFSLIQQNINGKGGSISGVNGGTPTTFYRPNRSVQSRIFTIDLGLGRDWVKWRLDLELLLGGLISDRRSYNFMLEL